MAGEGFVREPLPALKTRSRSTRKIKDPLVLEFLGLKDEYSESELENALVHHLEHFMLELGNDFAFIARQRAAPHRRRMVSRRSSPFSPEIALPRCDRPQTRSVHPCRRRANAPLPELCPRALVPAGGKSACGIILCAGKGGALVRYATDNLQNKVLVRELLTALPDEKRLATELDTIREKLERRQ